ncbi:MAG: ester cyclase, partial [Chloroflexota bacterium]|nr:ester cyclase [Chloroflexota bacterium]
VLTRWTMQATHTVPLFGRPPTGRQVVLRGMHVHRIRDGRIVEVWAAPDTLGLFIQLGLVRAPGAPDPLEANKVVVRRYFEEGFGPHGQALLDELSAPDYVEHGRGWFRVSDLDASDVTAGPTDSDGCEGLKGTRRWLLEVFRDLRFRVEQMVAQDDRVVAYSTSEGTHRGAFQGMAATGPTLPRQARGHLPHGRQSHRGALGRAR